MQHKKVFLVILLLAFSLSACGTKKTAPKFSDDNASEPFPTLSDTASNQKATFSKEFKYNTEIPVSYKTYKPDGVGSVMYKIKSVKELAKVGELTPDQGKKLVLVEFSYKGSAKNSGQPMIINQIGDTPAPQIVFIDDKTGLSQVEETPYSDAYAADKKLPELYKLTLDNDKLVDTALVFLVDQPAKTQLALRFTNPSGSTEFYKVSQ